MIEEGGGNLIPFVVLCAVLLVMLGGMVITTSAVRIVPEHQRLVVFRLGRLLRVAGPGAVILFPFIDSAARIDLREQDRHLTQSATTRDLIPVSIEYGWRYKILDPSRSVLQAPGNLDSVLRQLIQDSLGTLVGGMAFDQVRAERRQLDEAIRARLDQTAEQWGIQITHAAIRDMARA